MTFLPLFVAPECGGLRQSAEEAFFDGSTNGGRKVVSVCSWFEAKACIGPVPEDEPFHSGQSLATTRLAGVRISMMEQKMRKFGVLILSCALAACATHQNGIRSSNAVAFSDAEMAAFELTNARLNYAYPTIVYDGSGCARYVGQASNGRVRSELLRNASNQPLCDNLRVDAFTSQWLLDDR
ncbi:hypothetical protein V6R86_00595 [Sphingomonas kaistensis]|uniref:Uncharacterized protein n=1 Tax=Sphingomonas kaistensis TaxID=298708 RepID=A0ABZ2FWM2_9SPHN